MSSIKFVGKPTNRVGGNLKFKFDYWLALALGALLIVGLMMVFSASFDLGILVKEGDATYYFRRQIIALGIGLVGLVVVMQFDYHTFRKFSVFFMVATLILLLATLFVAEEIFGAKRGLSGGSFQPSEVAKLTTILYIAHWLSTKGDRIRDVAYGLLPFAVITGVVCALVVSQPDLSTAALIAAISFTVYFVAGADWRQFALAGVLGLAVFVALIIALPHSTNRINSYLQTWRDPSNAGYHEQQSLIALANGGWFGVGPGNSSQKFGPLPTPHTDSIFAIVGEEFGLIGALTILILLIVLVWRGLRTAIKARDNYGALLALGITCWIAYQAIINVGVSTVVVPFTGIPLPFISYGGSSLAISIIAAGILLNISRDAALGYKQRPPRKQTNRDQAAKSRNRRGRQNRPIVQTESLSESTRVRWRHRRSYLPGDRRTR